MRLIAFAVIVACAIGALNGCATETQRRLRAIEHESTYGAIKTYPYVAQEQRRKTIMEGVDKLRSGNSAELVRELLGPPDEVYPLYDKRKPHLKRVIGFNYVYVLRRDAERGAAYLKNEESIIIRFNPNRRLFRVVIYGFEHRSPVP